MGAKLSGSGGGKFNVEANSEINVTPFVDVMLVLLIIFMVAAPLASVSVEVTLPPAFAPPRNNPNNLKYVTVQANGLTYIGDTKVDRTQVGIKLAGDISENARARTRIFIRTDKDTEYRDFLNVMNQLQDQGFYSVALIGQEGAE